MLEVEDLHVRYGAIVALRGVSARVEAGELVAVVGANGAGKTTLLASIVGVVRPQRGRVLLAGRPITGETPERIVRRGIALVPETRDIFPDLTVEQNLRLGAYIRGDRAEFRRDRDEMCALFPILGQRLGQPAGTMSGGEQQQLAIARALMSHPRLLVLDEPSLGLAPLIVEQLFALIGRLHRQGTTILLVEQNVNQALRIADRAYLLSMGRVAMEGTPAEFRQQVDLASVYLGGAPAAEARP